MAERDRWIEALQARLEQVSASQDLSLVLEEAALTEARALAGFLLDDAASNLAGSYLLGWLHWYRYQALPEGEDQQDLRSAVAMLTQCFINGVSGMPESLLPILADEVASTAERLLEHMRHSEDEELLSVTVDLWQRVVAATPTDHRDYAGRLSNLAIALVTRFERTGAESDLGNAIDTARQAVHAAPAADPSLPMYLTALGNMLLTRFHHTGAETDLTYAIEAARQAVDAATAGDPNQPSYLSNLGNVLLARFGRTKATADLSEAIDATQGAIRAASDDDPNRPLYLSNLGNALATRFEWTGARLDLDDAIKAGQQAVHAIAADHPSRAVSLSILANALLTRYQRTAVTGDVENALDLARQTLLATPNGHPDSAGRLSLLAIALRARYEHTGDKSDLDDAIRTAQQAIQAIAGDYPGSATILSNLGIVLRLRFDRTGNQSDLDDAIRAGQQAVQAIAADDPGRAGPLSSLGTALRTRFERTGARSDLDDAIRAAQQAVQATPDGHNDRAMYLSSLGSALLIRFKRSGVPGDLDSAIEAARQAVHAIADGRYSRGAILSNLGIALRTRYELTKAPGDLDTAIEASQQAVQGVATDHLDRPAMLANLGIALRARYERDGAQPDLDNAIDIARQVVDGTLADHPNRVTFLSYLALSLRSRFERTGMAADRDSAFRTYEEAAGVDVAAASERIDACRAGAAIVAEADPERAASLLESAVLLLPEVAPQSLERRDQQYSIGGLAGLAAEAGAMALSATDVPGPERAARALRLVEAARGLLLTQALSTRGDLSELRARHPELARRFTELRDWLDSPAPAGNDLLPGLATEHRRQAAAEFTRLLSRIRGMEGFDFFVLPPTAEKLTEQAEQGPVVILNVTVYRSDAIILTRDGITSQPLPGLDQRIITEISAFYRGLGTIATAESPVARVRAHERIREVLAWLWDHAAGPVLQALGFHQPPSAGEPWPRLWWVPGGLMSLLPIHAAGHHGLALDPEHRTVMGRVISSYTPTIGALAHARAAQATAARSAELRSLVIAMPTTPDLPGEGRLTYISAEAEMLRARLPNPTFLTEPSDPSDDSRAPTKAAVLGQLPGHAIAHFACHGYTDPADPSQSQLLLHDHRKNPLTVSALASLDLEQAQLAYLSACSTASVAHDRLLDEAIHLSSAFQLAGFPQVIGTLWEIDDAAAVQTADAFYAALTNSDGTLDPQRAAWALHHATSALRDRWPAAAYLWASHVHVGA